MFEVTIATGSDVMVAPSAASNFRHVEIIKRQLFSQRGALPPPPPQGEVSRGGLNDLLRLTDYTVFVICIHRKTISLKWAL